MIDREYTLNRLKSRSITPQEFNYEILSAPPILSMFTVEDIQQLNYIATSAVYSAKLKEKYEAIDKIMNNRGFDKLVSGTNRVAYQPRFANNFIVKVAYDSVALKDSIREYKNQFLIKPFCTKVFEVSPCGTLGVFEKVNPITNRKEYISMAADIYKLLSEFIIGEYIIDDIGTEYFNNIGFRNGFGAVVLDFPYVYEVDGKKIWCNKPDHNDPTGYCNGAIDYDLGFNKLVCKKCGAVYKPFELAKKIEYNNEKQYIMESEDINMKIFVSGGSKGLKKQEIVTGDFRNPITAINSNKLNAKIEKQLSEEKKEKDTKKTVNGIAAPAKKSDEENADAKEDKTPAKEVEVETSEEHKEVKPAFTIDENSIGKGDLGYENDDEDDLDIGKLLAGINNLYYYSDTDDEERTKIVQNCCDLLEAIFMDNIEITMSMFANILRKKKSIKDEVIKDFLEKNNCSVNNQFIKLLLSSDNYTVKEEVDPVVSEDALTINVTTNIIKTKTNKVIYTDEPQEMVVEKDKLLSYYGATVDETIDEVEDPSVEYDDDLDLANAVTLSKKDLFPDYDNGKIIVVKNDDGSYLKLNGRILAIDHIDDRRLDDISYVANDWYDEVTSKTIKEAPVGSLPEDDEEFENEEGDFGEE